MNIATGKLDAPIQKQASILDAVTETGLALAKNKGLLGAAMPVESYALSGGLGAGASEVTKRLLKNRFKFNPRLKKLLEHATAYSAGGGSGLAASLARPLSETISKGTGADSARALAELTAMGTGGELIASPFLQAALKGGTVDQSALKTIGQMFGGGALALGGSVAKDKRLYDQYVKTYLTGNLPKRFPKPKKLDLGLRDITKSRIKKLKKDIPEGSLLALGGAGLMATGSPVLGAASLLSAPMRNRRVSKYIGGVAEELNKVKKNKKELEELYKKSSYNQTTRLSAPIYQTRKYSLAAPTLEKVAIPAYLDPRNLKKLKHLVSPNSYRSAGSTLLDFAAGATPQQRQIASKGRKLFGNRSRLQARQGQQALVSNIESGQAAAGQKLNPVFEEQAQLIQQGKNTYNPFKKYRAAQARRRQRYTPMYRTNTPVIEKAEQELLSPKGRQDAAVRMQQQAQEQQARMPAARGTTSQAGTDYQVTADQYKNYSDVEAARRTLNRDIGAVNTSTASAINRPEIQRLRQQGILTEHKTIDQVDRAKLDTLIRDHMAGGTPLDIGQLTALGGNNADDFARIYEGIMSRLAKGTPLTPSESNFVTYVKSIETTAPVFIDDMAAYAKVTSAPAQAARQTERQAQNLRLQQMGQTGRDMPGAASANAPQEGILGQAPRAVFSPSRYGMNTRSAANLEERLIREVDDGYQMEGLQYMEGVGGRTGMLRQGMQPVMRTASERAGLGSNAAKLRSEAAQALEGSALSQAEKQQVIAAYEESLVQNKGVFDDKKFQVVLNRMTGAADDTGRIVNDSQTIPGYNEVVRRLQNQALDETRERFGSSLSEYTKEVSNLVRKRLKDNTSYVKRRINKGVSNANKQTNNTMKPNVQSIQEMSTELERVHTASGSVDGQRISEVVTSTLNKENVTAQEILKLEQNLQRYLRGEEVTFSVTRGRGFLDNPLTSTPQFEFTTSLARAPQTVTKELSKTVNYGTVKAKDSVRKAFSVDGLQAEALTPEGRLINNSMDATTKKTLSTVANSGDEGEKIVSQILSGRALNVQDIEVGQRALLGVEEFATTSTNPDVIRVVNNALNNSKGIRKGLIAARRQVKNIRDPALKTEMTNELNALEQHYKAGAGSTAVDNLVSGVSTARNNALSQARADATISIVNPAAAEEAAAGGVNYKSLLGGVAVAGTGGGVAASQQPKTTLTQAKQRVDGSKTGSVTFLTAPVSYRVKTAMKPPVIKTPKPLSFKANDVTKAPVKADKVNMLSPMTATLGAKQRSMMQAPVGY